MATTSSHLNWLIIRNNNAFLLKKRDIKKPFSTEPNNLTNVSSYRYSGLVHKKTLGVVPAADKKGFTVVMKKGKYAQRPAKNTVKITMKAGPRRSLKKLRNLLTDNKYRKDLTQAALRRASAVLRSQKTPQVKKTKKPE
ncbi:ribosomal protein L28 [Cochliomyia hominivorax]